MASYKKQESLHSVTHWRKLRGIITDIANYERINLKNYDLNNIRCYRITGSDLKGLNVRANADNSRFCWVNDNYYDMYEIPMKSNNRNYEGKYLFFSHNTYFDYYLFGKEDVALNYSKTKQINDIVFDVFWLCYGKYSINEINGNMRIHKDDYGKNIDFGEALASGYFDSNGFRLREGYGLKKAQLLSKVLNKNVSEKSIAGSQKVEIYKKRKKRY